MIGGFLDFLNTFTASKGGLVASSFIGANIH